MTTETTIALDRTPTGSTPRRETALDPARVEAFAAQTVDRLNGGFLTLMTSIGHQTGLLDAMATLPPSTSSEIARAAGLSERYVREWLAAMVTGRIVDYDAATRTYSLPGEHAACLTRAAGPDNLASIGQFLPLLCNVEQAIVEVFRNGGGVHYEAYPRFHALMGELSAAVVDATLLTRVVPLLPGLTERLQRGIDVADVGCGRGDAIRTMAAGFPASRFLGLDFVDEVIAFARSEAARARLDNARFEVQDAATFGGPPRFDLITAFDAIHDQAQPRRVLRGIREALRPDGIFLMVDIAASSHLEKNLDHPLAPYLYAVSTMHCMTVSLAHDGEGLGTCWGEEKARELLAEAGFRTVDVTRIEGDILNSYYICRP